MGGETTTRETLITENMCDSVPLHLGVARAGGKKIRKRKRGTKKRVSGGGGQFYDEPHK